MSAVSLSFYARGVLKRIGELTDQEGRSFYYGNSRTRDSLIRKGLIEEAAYGTYRITNAGRLALEPVIKTCACGKTYTKTTWKLLDFVGHWDDSEPANPEHPEYGEPQGLLEQRNCACGSTLLLPCSELEK